MSKPLTVMWFDYNKDIAHSGAKQIGKMEPDWNVIPCTRLETAKKLAKKYKIDVVVCNSKITKKGRMELSFINRLKETKVLVLDGPKRLVRGSSGAGLIKVRNIIYGIVGAANYQAKRMFHIMGGTWHTKAPTEKQFIMPILLEYGKLTPREWGRLKLESLRGELERKIKLGGDKSTMERLLDGHKRVQYKIENKKFKPKIQRRVP